MRERWGASEWTRERGSDRAVSGGTRRAGERAMGSQIARSEIAKEATDFAAKVLTGPRVVKCFHGSASYIYIVIAAQWAQRGQRP